MLPHNVLCLIATWLDDHRDMRAMATTCRRWCACVSVADAVATYDRRVEEARREFCATFMRRVDDGQRAHDAAALFDCTGAWHPHSSFVVATPSLWWMQHSAMCGHHTIAIMWRASDDNRSQVDRLRGVVVDAITLYRKQHSTLGVYTSTPSTPIQGRAVTFNVEDHAPRNVASQRTSAAIADFVDRITLLLYALQPKRHADVVWRASIRVLLSASPPFVE